MPAKDLRKMCLPAAGMTLGNLEISDDPEFP